MKKEYIIKKQKCSKIARPDMEKMETLKKLLVDKCDRHECKQFSSKITIPNVSFIDACSIARV